MKKPFFSIIIPVHNSEKYVDKGLRSIIKQTFQDYEALIINDNSTDGTLDVVKKVIRNKGNFKIINLEKNMGVANARNIGIEAASGKYICFLDDDDIWLINKLEVEHKEIIDKKLDWVFSNYEVLNEKYQHVSNRLRSPGFYGYNKIIAHGNPIGLLTVAIKTEILKCNLFRDVGHEDYDLWLRLANQGYQGYLIKSVLAQYLKRNNSRSSNKFRSIAWTYRCYKSNGCSTVKAFLLIFSYALNTISRNKS